MSMFHSTLIAFVLFSIVHPSTKELIKENSDLPPVRAHHALVYDEKNKQVVLTAGSSPLNGGSSFALYNDLWAWNGRTWKLLGKAGDERSGIGLAYDSKQNKIISFGGFANNQSLSDLRVLEETTWKKVSNLPDNTAAEPGFVYDSHRNKFVLFGGSAARGKVNNTTWEWDGKEWKQLEGAGPEGRQAFAMVYDSKRKRTVLFGGMGAEPTKRFGDTWEFDGTKWTLADTTGPSARVSPGYAYDDKRGLLIIFGGMSAGGMLGDTWSWNGKSWKQVSDKGPAPRAMGYMAYDKKRDKVVLFGGRLKWPNDANDTWEWDGKEWKEIKE